MRGFRVRGTIPLVSVLIALIILGLLITFVPTINHPSATNVSAGDSSKAYEKYNVDLFFALVKINETPIEPVTIVFMTNELSITLRPLSNASGFAYDAEGELTLSFPLNGSEREVTIHSSGVISADSPLAKLLIINEAGRNLSVNVSGLSIRLRKVTSGNDFMGYEEYFGNGTIINTVIKRFTYLRYYITGKDKLVLASYVDMVDKAGWSHSNILDGDKVAAQLIKLLLKGTPYADLVWSNEEKVNNVNIGLNLVSINARSSSNTSK